MINTKRALLLLPPYLILVTAVDTLFDSAGPDGSGSTSVPMWIVVGFVVSALGVAAITLWYLVRRASGKVPAQRHPAYLALLVAVVVPGLVTTC